MNKKHIVRKIFCLRHRGLSCFQIHKLINSYYPQKTPRSFVENILKQYKFKPSKYTNYQRKIALSLYKKHYNTDKVVQYLNKRFSLKITKNALYVLSSRSGIKKNTQNMYEQSYVTRKDEYEISKLYKKGYTTTSLAEMYGYKTPKSINDKIRKLKIPLRDSAQISKNKRRYKDFSLETIDSKEKAYFIGLLVTDGNVIKNYDGIQLSLTDKDCIEFLSNYININYQVIHRKNSKTMYRISLFGKEYCNQTKRLGMIKRKSLTLPPLRLREEEKEFLPYIIRGIIDGDGWIRKDGKEFFICSASEKFIHWCKESLIELGMKDLKLKFNSNGVYTVRTGREYNIRILNEKIYDKAFGMMRKYKRVKQEGPSETIIRDTLSKKSIWYSPDYNTNIVCGLGNQVW